MAGEVRWFIVDSVTGAKSEVVSIAQPTTSPAGNAVNAKETAIVGADYLFGPNGEEFFVTSDAAGALRTLKMTKDANGNKTFTG